MTWHFPATAHAAARPHARAVSVDGEALSWHELLTRSAELQRVWEAQLPVDARVLFPAERSLRFVVHFVAILRTGRHIVLVSPDATAEELAHARHAAQITHAVALQDLPALEARVAIHAEHASNSGDPRPTPLEAAPWNPERVLLSVLTSGTTGKPKAIELSAEQVIFSTLGSAARLGSLPTDRWHAPLPLHHVGGIMVLLRALILGFEAEYTSHFDGAISAARLASGEVNIASFVPVMLERILDLAPNLQQPPNLRAILLGGAASPDALLRRAAAAGLPVARSWGMSETSSQIATAAPSNLDGPLAPLPFVRLEVEDARLVIDGPQALNGRFASADQGELVEGGVRVLGRADDIFISGGENVDPSEIERVLRAHPRVREALVVGVPSPRWGQEAVAFIACVSAPSSLAASESEAQTASLLRAHCEAALERYKIPKSFYFVEDVPRNSMGKPSRKLAMDVWNTTHADRENGASAPSDSTSGATP